MKKLLVVVAVLVVPIFISTGAWALTVNDQEGVAGAYYGGIFNQVTNTTDINGDPIQIITQPPYAHDTIPGAGQPGDTQFSVTSLEATKVGTNIQVVLSGPYFGGFLAYSPMSESGPGDLYISTKGWVVSTPSADGHADADKFVASEGWDRVIKFSAASGTNNTNIYNFNILDPSYHATAEDIGFDVYRTDQAFTGGYSGAPIGVATSTLNVIRKDTDFPDDPFGTLTFIFPNPQNLDPDLLGYHWTMECGNDVVEGGGTPVPEPGSLLLLGFGLVGLAVYRRKAR